MHIEVNDNKTNADCCGSCEAAGWCSAPIRGGCGPHEAPVCGGPTVSRPPLLPYWALCVGRRNEAPSLPGQQCSASHRNNTAKAEPRPCQRRFFQLTDHNWQPTIHRATVGDNAALSLRLFSESHKDHI